MRKHKQSWYASIVMMVSFLTIQCVMLGLVSVSSQPIAQEVETLDL